MIFNPNHLKNQNTTYPKHLCFALLIALRMLLTTIVLVFHAIIPIIQIPKSLTILGTSNYLYDKHFKLLDQKKSGAEK